MSDWTSLGTVSDADGLDVEVSGDEHGSILLEHAMGSVEITAGWLAALTELIDRAAVPGQPPAAEAAERMAITPDGDVKPVSQFTADEKWWCDGEECCDGENCDGDHLKAPHVHPWHGPARPVDLLTGGEIPA